VARMIRFSLGATPCWLTPESRVPHGRRAKWFILQAVSMLAMIAAGTPSHAQQPSPLVMQGLGHAGHLPPFLNGEEIALPPALPLGLVPDAEYEPIEVSMSSGDRLTLYTDGLLEARNVTGELFGFTRIAEFLATPRDAKEIAEAAQQFGQEDDITVLTLTFAGVGVIHA
jgi:hypothetical protein